jgi:hypothetical protein
MRITNSGNLGLGVTPSAWGSPFTVFQLGAFGQYISGQTNVADLKIGTNHYYNGSTYVYTSTGSEASRYDINRHSFVWNLAPSGTAGNAISFTQAMTLGANGNLLVGTTTDNGARLQVSGNVTVSGITQINNQLLVYSSNGLVRTSNADAAGMLHIRPNAGQNGYINFTENAVDDRWSIGVTAGDGSFYFRRPYPTSPALVTIASTGAATFSSNVTVNGYLTATAGGGTSDLRVKNVSSIDPKKSILDILYLREYTLIENKSLGVYEDSRKRWGFATDDVRERYPELIFNIGATDKAESLNYTDLHNMAIIELRDTKAEKTELQLLREEVKELRSLLQNRS